MSKQQAPQPQNQFAEEYANKTVEELEAIKEPISKRYFNGFFGGLGDTLGAAHDAERLSAINERIDILENNHYIKIKCEDLIKNVLYGGSHLIQDKGHSLADLKYRMTSAQKLKGSTISLDGRKLKHREVVGFVKNPKSLLRVNAQNQELGKNLQEHFSKSL